MSQKMVASDYIQFMHVSQVIENALLAEREGYDAFAIGGTLDLGAVNSEGRRFFDEGLSYHHFVRAMYRSHRGVPSIPAWLVCDRRFVWKYGIGMIHPLTLFLKPFIDREYLHAADSVEELARKIGVGMVFGNLAVKHATGKR
jgi:hypothetical protein